MWTYVWCCPINSKQLLGGAIHLMEFQGKPIICLSPFDASCFPTGEPAVRVRSDVMGCNCYGAASRPGGGFPHTAKPRLSQRRRSVPGPGGWTGGRSTGCLKCVKEAERKIFPLGCLLPPWFPFIPRKEPLGDAGSPSSDPLTQMSAGPRFPDPGGRRRKEADQEMPRNYGRQGLAGESRSVDNR